MKRSWLFVPGDSERKLVKAWESGADALIIDWEDALGAEQKPVARAMLKEMLQSRPSDGPAVYVRVNGLQTTYFQEDMRCLPQAGIDGLVLPKACGLHSLKALTKALQLRDQENGSESETLQILAIVTETAASVLALTEFKAPYDRLEGLLWGGEDLAADLGIRDNRDELDQSYKSPFRLARDLTLMAAAATESLPVDAVYTRYSDLKGLERECLESRSNGFLSKAAIHPNQIPIINAIFQPTESELKWARNILGALDSSKGVAVYDGEMIDAPHLRLAERLLKAKIKNNF